MAYTTLISVDDLAAHLEDPNWAIVDCRFYLAAPEQGRQEYLAGHIPGAVYAHIDNDLSAPVVRGQTGRHPLPDVNLLAQKLGAWGIGPGVQVVAYDASGGGMAARLWWLLGWLGHAEVALLDGGWPAWTAQGRPTRSGEETRPPREFVPRPQAEWVVTADEVEQLRTRPDYRVADARNPERYRGDVEPIDPVAGHIPGAVCLPYVANLDANGFFLPPEQLRQRFEAVLQGVPAERTVVYCGSGVTAAHNVLAMAHAGLGIPRLYAGSWSEWITDPNRPVAVGDQPA